MNEYIITIGDNKHQVFVENPGKVIIDGEAFEIEIEKVNPNLYLLRIGSSVFDITTQRRNNEEYDFLIDGCFFRTGVRTKLREKAHEFLERKEKLSHSDSIKAPMPGMVLNIHKKKGDQINIGEPVIILEAMKMENEIRSPATGVIKELYVVSGDSVEKDTILLTIE